MIVDLRFLVRLLMVIILVSLISTLFLGNRIHKRKIEPIKFNGHPFIVNFFDWDPNMTLSLGALNSLKVRMERPFSLPLAAGPRIDWQYRGAWRLDQLKKLKKQGEPANWNYTGDTKNISDIFRFYSINGMIGDRIFLNSSLLDTRPPVCVDRKYMENLPNVTVVIAFHNEELKVILRTVDGLINRSPPELLKEIILVDDGSTVSHLNKAISYYVKVNFPAIIRIWRIPESVGIIKARLAGAKLSNCQVLIFMDSHVEVGYNWLPPLLEPIVINPNIVTSPIRETILPKTFKYKSVDVKQSGRLGFNWRLELVSFIPLHVDLADGSRPFRTPLVEGTVAIDKYFFWDLGGYDENLNIWGGVLELSFKAWMCGGMLLNIPCSRVGHVTQNNDETSSNLINSSIPRSYKRVAEVWMDEYKKYVYSRDPEIYANVATNYLLSLKQRRQALSCYPFEWYMKNVAMDVLQKYPVIEPPPIFAGTVHSLAHPDLCLSVPSDSGQNFEASECIGNLTHPNPWQNWGLNSANMMRNGAGCLSLKKIKINSALFMYKCLGAKFQCWVHNEMNKWIKLCGQFLCLEATQEWNTVEINIKSCDRNKLNQRWKFVSAESSKRS